MSDNAALRIAKNTGALMLGKGSVLAVSFFFIIYVARLLGIDGFGKYALLKSYFELFLNLGATGLCIVVTREVAQHPAQLHRHLGTSLVLILALVSAAAVVLVGLVHLLPYAQDTRLAAYLVGLALVPAGLGRLFEAVFIAHEKAELVAYGTLLENILRTGLGIGALALGYGLFALFVSLIVARVGMLVLYLVFLGRVAPNLAWQFDPGQLRQLVSSWRVFALENWSSSLFWKLGVIILSVLHSEAAVGIYSAAAKLMTLFNTVSASYTTAIYPYMSRLHATSPARFRLLIERSLKYMLALVLPGIIMMTTLADELIVWLYTAEFAASIPVLQILLWVVLIRFLGPFLSHVLFSRGEQQRSLWATVISLPVYAVLAFWFTWRWSEVGTAWALLAGASLTLTLYLFYVLRPWPSGRLAGLWLRTAAAAGGLGVFLWILDAAPPLLVLPLGALLYLALLLLLRVLTLREFEALHRKIRSGLRQLRTAPR